MRTAVTAILAAFRSVVGLTQGAAAQDAAADAGQETVQPDREPDLACRSRATTTAASAMADGEQTYINIQPVIPISIGPNWNLISRTILPVVSQSDFHR